MYKISEQDVNAVIDLTLAMQGTRYMPARKERFANAVAEMEPSTKWLLTFCCWHCLFNSSFKSLKEDQLYRLPKVEKSNVEFHDFLMLIRRYEGIKISPSRIAPTLRFLMKCDEVRRPFYVSLLTKDWINAFPMLEVQTLLDLDSITKELVYGDIEYLKTGFSGLSYPVAIMNAAHTKLKPFILVREANYSSLLIRNEDGGYKVGKKPSWVDLDLTLSSTPRFVVAGFMSETRMYPTDFFGSYAACSSYLKDEPDAVPDYDRRIDGLHEFQFRSLLVNIESEGPDVAYDEEELADSLLEALAYSKDCDLVITDSNSVRTGEAYKLHCKLSEGVIEDLWVTDGKAVGFKVWFNGSLVNCTYTFVGKEKAIVAAPDVVKGKILEFYEVPLPEPLYLGNEVCWHSQRWREMKLREADMWIEKCVLCGGTRSKHVNHGICRSCECNMHYYFNKYGVGNWIPPSIHMVKKRNKTSWKSSLLNVVNYKYKGHFLEADEAGNWMFKPKE